MIANYNFHIWFRVCKSVKAKYNLSTNCLLVLNGAYTLHQVTNKPFTRRQLLSFVRYYDNVRIGKYMTVLMSNGFISLAGLRATRQLYCISSLGLQVIAELNKSYEDQLYLFCNKYNIEL
jgi:hypothetical protein